jgi:hypothetical protein
MTEPTDASGLSDKEVVERVRGGEPDLFEIIMRGMSRILLN